MQNSDMDIYPNFVVFYIELDDPISSFDSVYKNKIAFCIIKFLENKKQIILTHNTDLIRLLEVQLIILSKFALIRNVIEMRMTSHSKCHINF